jgi:hypothetical protein
MCPAPARKDESLMATIDDYLRRKRRLIKTHQTTVIIVILGVAGIATLVPGAWWVAAGARASAPAIPIARHLSRSPITGTDALERDEDASHQVAEDREERCDDHVSRSPRNEPASDATPRQDAMCDP